MKGLPDAMDGIAAYRGALLSHVETLYRPGERELAIELVEALGCSVTDTGFMGDGVDTFLAVHPNPNDPDPQNNVFYMSQVRPEQLAVEDHLKQLGKTDAGFAAQLSAYRNAARTKPFGVPHFALRLQSTDAIRRAETRIKEEASEALRERVHLRVFYPLDADAAVGTVVQGFLYQDVVVSGSFLMGQLIELQAQP
jgi:hypothetical protein